MNPFNNDFFNGRCDKVSNPSTRRYDRLPWNVGVLSYQVSHNHSLILNMKETMVTVLPGSLSSQTLVEETVSKEIYESSHSLLRELLKEVTFSFDAELSVKFTPSESNSTIKVSPEVGFSKKDMIKKVSEKTNTQVNVRNRLAT